MSVILHFCTSSDLLPTISRLLLGLAAEGLEIHLACSAGPEFDALREDERIRCHPLEMVREVHPLKDSLAVVEAIRLIKALDPKIVHGHHSKAGLIAMTAAQACGVKQRFYHVHGLPYTIRKGPRRALFRNAERATIYMSSRTFSVSASIRTQLIIDGLIAAPKIEVLGHGSAQGIEIPDVSQKAQKRSEFRRANSIPEAALVLLYNSRLNPEKGLIELEQAWLELRSHYPESYLILAGPEDSAQPVNITGLRHDGRVLIFPALPDRSAAYWAADLVVLPSYREGLPLSLLEAAAYGVPTIATQTLGCVDAVLPHETGILIPPYDPEALIEAMDELMQNAERRHKLGAAGRKWVSKQFAPRPLVVALAEIYKEVL